MAKLSMWKLLCLRYAKYLLPSSLINFLVLGLIGLIVISNTLPSATRVPDILNHEEYETIAYVYSDGFGNKKTFQNILNDIGDINQTIYGMRELKIDYIFSFSFMYNNGTDYLPIVYICFSDNFFSKFLLNSSEIFASPNVNPGELNLVSNSYDYNCTLIVHRTIDLPSLYTEFQSIVHILFTMYSDYSMRYNLGYINLEPVNYYIIGNVSTAIKISSKLHIQGSSVLGLIYVHNNPANFKGDTVKEVYHEIFDDEKAIFNLLIMKEVTPDRIIFYSPIKHQLESLEDEVISETISIQSLGIPNLIIVLLCVFQLDIGFIRVLKNEGDRLWSRGLSLKDLMIFFYGLELLADFLVILIMQALGYIIILKYNLFRFLLLNLFTSFLILTIIINIVRLYKYLQINYNPLVERSYKKSAQKLIPDFYVTPKLRKILDILLIVIFCYQIFRVFEPLFWRPLSGAFYTIYKYFTLIVTIIILLVHFLPTNSSKSSANALSLPFLLRRIFSNSFRKFKIQQVIATGLFFILIFLLSYQISYKNYYQFKNAYEPANDIFIFEQNACFPYNRTLELPQNIECIDQVYPLIFSGVTVLHHNKYYSAQMISFDALEYSNKSLGWNHFFGKLGDDTTLATKLKNDNIIVNQAAADTFHINKNDVVTLTINYYINSNVIVFTLENMHVSAVVDTLPIFGLNNWRIPEIYLDISHILKYYEKSSLEARVNTIGLDLNKGEKAITQVVQEVYSFLNVSSSFGRYSFLTKQNTDTKVMPGIDFFIWFNLSFILIFIPIFILIQLNVAFDEIRPGLKKLLLRGCQEKYLKELFIHELYRVLFTSLSLGLITGVIIGLFNVFSIYPSLLLAQDTKLHFELFINLGGALLGSFIISYLIVKLVDKKMNLVLNSNRKGVH